MKRYTITWLVSMGVLGFINSKAEKEFLNKIQPLQLIERRIYSLDQETRVVLESKSYSALFDIAQFESVCQYFKKADMFLANSQPDKEHLSHLLVFALSNGYFAVLTPFTRNEYSKGDNL